ncbi:FadR/GntR family transcriptional regulator [Mycolicibacterium confluentis]|nr:FCD domain-containing protein [Mycolicibacterium confluentis]MCV7319512.1 FadR family transcriptional regulator [Mycolicibacterium confluentis]ORV34836.1 GntR family transcriptional regulator [Mycolicibacterium confluentis]
MAAESPGPRAAQIAALIETEIIRRGWPVGESLGSEAALQLQYSASRSVLREAVRLVEHHQVARMRKGPNGGLVITEPDAAPATRAMVIYLEYAGVTIDELLAARLLLEPLASGLAAERIDEAGIDRLRTSLAASGSPRRHDEFHVALAELTGNPVLALFVDILTRLTARYALDTRLPSESEVSDTVRRLSADHAGIVEAITAGDSARAKTLTGEHVRMVTDWLRQHYRSGTRRAAPAVTEPGKRAEVLATQIRRDIAAGGWRTGSVFGAEADLLERYAVSRSVLREAVRLLEYHTVARMRRGPGGGLIVTEPQPGPALDTVALYLEYRRPTAGDVRQVREAIEVDNVVTVVERRDDPTVAAFLADHAAAEVPPPEVERVGQAELCFHNGIADLAGNRVLNMFLAILAELVRRHWTPTQQPVPAAADVADMHHAHVRIIEAIRSGDASLAQHRSRRHLEALSSWWMHA